MKNKQVAAAALVLVLVVVVGWAMGFFAGKDPQITELEQLRDVSMQNRENMDDEQRRATREQFREKIGQLPEEKRKEFFENSRPMFQKMINERMDKFFAMSEEEQNAELDERIDRAENRAADGRGGGRGGPGGRWGGKEMSQKQRDQRRKEMLDRTTPELRAKFDKYKDMMNDRRSERGLPPSSGRGWR